MGVYLKGLIEPKKIELKDLKGKIVAIDAFNALYQFISTIRQYDGSSLVDSNGNVTSHLSGLFYRTLNLMKQGIKVCYVFDGKAPEFKKQTVSERINIRNKAREEYKQALSEGNYEKARTKSMQSAILTKEMINEAKELLTALGLPYIDAPSEGEAQASRMANNKDVYCCVSQDYDSLLFKTPLLVRNLNITGKRKIPGKNLYTTIYPEIIDLNSELKRLEISHEQLIMIAILIGTDYNPKGINGIGPKKAYKLIKEKQEFDKIFESVNWTFDITPKEIYDFFINPPVSDDYKIEFKNPNYDKLKEILCTRHDFSESRINNSIGQLKELNKKKSQTALDKFF